MAKLPPPPPPAQLAAIKPEIRRVPAGSLWWRVYFRRGAYPTAWSDFRAYGPTNSRFDHQRRDSQGRPRLQRRRVLYAAEEGATCLAEVFQDTRVIDRHSGSPWLVGFALATDLELLDLTGVWPTRAGASQAINNGPRPRAREWARAIYDAYTSLDGLWYRSSMHGGKPAQALFDRAEARGALPVTPLFHRGLADPHLLVALRNAARGLGYLVV